MSMPRSASSRRGGQARGGRARARNLAGVDRSAAGRKGGLAVVHAHGPSHMAEIGRKGARARNRNR